MSRGKTLYHVGGTNLLKISAKPQRNNKSGVTGVAWDKRVGKWSANIIFRKKHIFLGYFADFNAAVAARKAAEEKYFGPEIQKFCEAQGIKPGADLREAFISKTFGTMYVDRVAYADDERTTNMLAYGHCTICGTPMRRTCAALLRANPKCKNGCTAEYPPAPKSEHFDVIRPVGSPRGSATIWEVRCHACGKLVNFTRREIKTHKSCGCLAEDGREKGRKAMREKYAVEGTSIPSIKPDRALNKNSTTGIKGVSQLKNGSYRAYIFRGRKQIDLGRYPTLEEAAEARRRGEQQYFAPVIERWEADGNSLSEIKGPYIRKTPPRKGHKNITFTDGKWRVSLQKNNRTYSAGRFDTEADAIAARDKLRAELGLPPVE